MPNPGKKILDHLYNVENKSLQQIGDIYGVSRERVRQWMEKWNLPRRKSGNKDILDSSAIKICDEYIRGERVVELAKKYQVCHTTIYKFLLKQNSNIRLERKKFRGKEKI